MKVRVECLWDGDDGLIHEWRERLSLIPRKGEIVHLWDEESELEGVVENVNWFFGSGGKEIGIDLINMKEL